METIEQVAPSSTEKIYQVQRKLRGMAPVLYRVHVRIMPRWTTTADNPRVLNAGNDPERGKFSVLYRVHVRTMAQTYQQSSAFLVAQIWGG
jgi:hypothetical protein